MKQVIAITAACGAATLLAAWAIPGGPDVPEALKPASNETLFMIVPARGVQVYECRPKPGGEGHAWAFVAPEAELFDARGRAIGVHGAGPVWQAKDGSRVQGTVKARADAPAAGDVPWLLLATKSAGTEGTFSRVSSIQRVNTKGGMPPADGCGPQSAGKEARVPYTADYRLFGRH